MLQTFIKTLLRTVWTNKGYTFLNIAGLAIGIASAAIIFLWVEDELQFNHNFAKHDRLYHVMQNEKNDGGVFTNGSTPGPLAAALKADLPGVVNSGRLSWAMDELGVVGNKSIKINGMYADPSVLSMYDLPFVFGKPSAALGAPKTIVISESMSRNFFGAVNPVGKTIQMNAKGSYSVDGLFTVTGVFKDLPANSYYHFQWLSPYTDWETANPWLMPWNNNLTETIVELTPTANLAVLNKKLTHYLSTKNNGATGQCFLFAMNDWHLRSNFVNGVQEGGAIKYVNLFSLVACIILLIACINFMNLSTARSGKRAREVGVRKVMGATARKLVGKFMAESLLLSFFAVAIALVIVALVLPLFNELVGKQLSLAILKPLHLFCLFSIAVVTGVTAGSYPAFYLSSFNPVQVLKGTRLKNTLATIFIRKGLVIIQFAASVVLIIASVVVYQQVQHIRQRDLGYNKNNLVYIGVQGNLKTHFPAIRQQLLATGMVENAATSLHDALHVHSYGSGYNWPGRDPNMKIPVHSNVVGSEYLSTMHMHLLEGRDFYPANADSNHVIINESLAKLMGKAGKVGAIITSGQYQLTVVGIIKDFIYNDVYGTSDPLILVNGGYAATVMALRFKPGVPTAEALEKTAGVLKAENPGIPFEYNFADKDFETLFAAETLIGKLAGLFASLAIFISCLGLFGLAAYTAERRTKEIGIRKVLGASVAGLTGLLAKEFLLLVTASCIIAFPLAWLLMTNWLNGYAYRTTVNWQVFALTGSGALLIALMTVSFQSIKAALLNPVKSLRSE